MEKKKRLLVYAHYYYPDVASTGQILKELCEGMIDTFDITVICVVPSYTGKIEEIYKEKKYYIENINGVNIIRVRVPEFTKENKKSRVLNLLSYFFRAIWATFKSGKQDYVFSISQPPILGGILGVIGKYAKRAKFIYNIQDFNPEQTIAVGYSKSKLLLNFAMFLDKLSCILSDKIIVVGRDMQKTLKDRFKNKKIPNNTFINNWIDENEIYPLSSDNKKVLEFKRKYGLDDKIVIMYSGNIGLYYDLENLIKVIGRFKDREDVVFAFVGEGTVKRKLIQYVTENQLGNVKFIPYQPKEDLIYSLNAGDIHLVSNAKGIKGVSVPSKLYGVMAAGKYVFGVLEKETEGRLILEDAKCGICVDPENYNGIFINLEFCINNINEIKSIGKNGEDYIANFLRKDISINKYIYDILNTE